MANHKGDLDNNNENKQGNYLENNNDDNITQYIIVVHLSNKFFLHLLIAKDFSLLDKSSEAQYFVFDWYIEIIFQSIMSDTEFVIVSTTSKCQSNILQHKILLIELDGIYTNEATI